jgi:hypothetical protein
MSLEHLSRLSQAIVNASETASQEAKTKAQKDAALVVNSIGERSTAFSTAVDMLGDAIKTARGAKLARARDNKEIETEQPAKSLAELLAESAQNSE